MTFFTQLRHFFSKEAQPAPPPSAEDQKQEELFKGRYHAFRRLLSANNAALDIMAELEEAARGECHFGMHFLRARVTAMTAKIYTIVQNMGELAPEKYAALPMVMRKIQTSIQEALERQDFSQQEKAILPLASLQAADARDVGGKMANLGELRNVLGLDVPEGFAITAHAYMDFMCQTELWEEINCLVLGHPMAAHFGVQGFPDPDQENDDGQTPDQPIALFELCARIRGRILEAAPPKALSKAILAAYDCLNEQGGGSVHVALRSSALGEDGRALSFAGQYRSLLNIDRESLLEGYQEIIASKYSPHAMSYRYMRGIRDDEVHMCVGCLVMVPSQVSGVLYTASPFDPKDRHIRITATWGLGKGVVDGSTQGDVFLITRAPDAHIASRNIAHKTQGYFCASGEGLVRKEISKDKQDAPCLTDKQIFELTAIAERIEAHYQEAQDIEWTITPEEKILVLQARPLDIQKSTMRDNKQTASLEDIPILASGGETASSGAARGIVHLARKDVDILVLPENPILVCVEALPKWATVLGRVQGIIAEQGSTAGHLASVCREFRVPAIFGFPQATRLLSAGQSITIDADACRVYAGEQKKLLVHRPEKPKCMEGSPVFQTLKRVQRFITPLSLLDPESLEFTPEYCQSLHDITRFCHEKAVHEMFRFGRDHNFLPRASKQLKTQIPMQWWVLNLDDGFFTETSGNLVLLDNIASAPMLALWRGIIAFPWEGPPNLDGKGFMSVLFQSVTNTNLEPAMPSSYSEKNYFMISKQFCSLQSRFGYHFTSVEALAGNRKRENYIRFQFKGGATDLPRRKRRARFVGDILEHFDFQIRVREDALFARLDNSEQQFIENHLEFLGHLLIHTRQLDMIMSNERVVEQYQEKILAQLHAIRDEQKQ